ncbi:E3 ubiquitin-protein ligase RNF181-like [Clavelina lepadiformis]|uniref:E3 ubiquitin-protein ligase RNF181 n=1 Tax=Clavelina lepadiformis TaxID=159417 RepID=A0ABP0GUP1_CLALP
MASYFDEHDCEPTTSVHNSSRRTDLLRMLRLFLRSDVEEYGHILGQFIPDGESLAPPAAKSVVENLPRISLKDLDSKKDAQCPVCLAQFDNDDVIITMPCEHYFHMDCLLPWLQKTNSCPLCRFELVTDDPDYEELKKEKLGQKEREARVADLHSSMFG